MRQRVGIARALVTNPDVLLMDEAFSALDVLTGETLRNDILELWDSASIPTRGILVVSHNIEEAVMMADRIIVLASDPGRIRSEYTIDVPRPRNVDSAQVRALIDEVYGLMTMRPVPAHAAPSAAVAPADYRLPDTDVSRIEGVLDLLASDPFKGRADLPQLADEAGLPDEELFPTYEALGLLGLAHVEKGDITLTSLGHRFAEAGQTLRQEIFGQQLLTHVPLAARIRKDLEAEPSGTLSEEPFIDLLEEALKADEAARTLEIAIEWGRYGEVFEYDYNAGVLKLPDQEAGGGACGLNPGRGAAPWCPGRRRERRHWIAGRARNGVIRSDQARPATVPDSPERAAPARRDTAGSRRCADRARRAETNRVRPARNAASSTCAYSCRTCRSYSSKRAYDAPRMDRSMSSSSCVSMSSDGWWPWVASTSACTRSATGGVAAGREHACMGPVGAALLVVVPARVVDGVVEPERQLDFGRPPGQRAHARRHAPGIRAGAAACGSARCGSL